MVYHIGLCKGGGYDGHSKRTVIVQARRSIDFLSCELWRYEGQRETTKAKLRANKTAILAWINGFYKTEFRYIVID